MAETVRKHWPEVFSGCESIAISVDGHHQYDEVHVCALTSDYKLELGMIGLAEPLRGDKETLPEVT